MKLLNTVGIKRKTRLGCVVLGFILFFSSLMTLYEFSNMNSYVTRVLTENVESVDETRILMESAEEYNLQLLYAINGNQRDLKEIDTDDLVLNFSKVRSRFNKPEQRAAADSVVFAYSAYMQIASEAEKVWENGHFERSEWFFNRLQPVYVRLRGYVQDLSFVSQDALIENSMSLQRNFYRSMMPSMVSVILSLLLVVLFNYYLNYFLINPFLKVTKGINDYRKFNISYNVRIDGTDEISELNSAVDDIIDLNQSYRAKLFKKDSPDKS